MLAPEECGFALQTCGGLLQVSWIQFDTDAVSARSPSGYRGGARAKKRVQNDVTDEGEHLYQAHGQFFGKGCGVHLRGSSR